MASDFVLTEKRSFAIVESVRTAAEKIEVSLGDLCIKGKIKAVYEQDSEKLMEVSRILDGLKCVIERFQSDHVKVSSKDTLQLEVPLRLTTIEAKNNRDSGYNSEIRLSAALNTPEQSSNRLSRADPNDLERISSDEAELYNPSSSGSNSSSTDKEDSFDKARFYIRDSETSLSDLDDKIYDEETIPKVQVDSSQLCADPHIGKGRYEETPDEDDTKKVVKEENNHTTESHNAKRKSDNADDNTIPKVIEERHVNSVPTELPRASEEGRGDFDTTALNNLSKRSSEEDNTKYAADEPETGKLNISMQKKDGRTN